MLEIGNHVVRLPKGQVIKQALYREVVVQALNKLKLHGARAAATLNDLEREVLDHYKELKLKSAGGSEPQTPQAAAAAAPPVDAKAKPKASKKKKKDGEEKPAKKEKEPKEAKEPKPKAPRKRKADAEGAAAAPGGGPEVCGREPRISVGSAAIPIAACAQEPAKKKPRKSKKEKAKEAAAGKKITPQDVTAQLADLHGTLMAHDKAMMLFNEPVDIVKYNIPDYPKIIETPMDFGTIKTKLANHEYKDHLEYCDDVRLVFNNAWTFNKKATNVYKFTSEVSKYFDTCMWY